MKCYPEYKASGAGVDYRRDTEAHWEVLKIKLCQVPAIPPGRDSESQMLTSYVFKETYTCSFPRPVERVHTITGSN